MASWRKASLTGPSFPRRLLARFRRDFQGAATVEFAILLPVILSMLVIIVVGGEGFELNRKITMVVRTLTDLATQQTNIGTSSTTYTYTQILNAASLVVQPYSSSSLGMVLSEISTNGSGTGTVTWSKANSNATALSAGSSVTVPSNITSSGYLILGTASYSYTPLGIFIPMAAFTITDSLYLAPRTGANVSCCS
jgi:Flp pilus assembly protein TadG